MLAEASTASKKIRCEYSNQSLSSGRANVGLSKLLALFALGGTCNVLEDGVFRPVAAACANDMDSLSFPGLVWAMSGTGDWGDIGCKGRGRDIIVVVPCLTDGCREFWPREIPLNAGEDEGAWIVDDRCLATGLGAGIPVGLLDFALLLPFLSFWWGATPTLTVVVTVVLIGVIDMPRGNERDIAERPGGLDEEDSNDGWRDKFELCPYGCPILMPSYKRS